MLMKERAILNRFEYTVDDLNNIYTRLLYNFYKSGFSNLDSLSVAYIEKTHLLQQEIITTPVIQAVRMYNVKSLMYYDSRVGFKSVDQNVLKKLKPGFSRIGNELFYTGIADLYTDSGVVVSFQINEDAFISGLRGENNDILFCITGGKSEWLLGDPMPTDNVPDTEDIYRVSVNAVEYLCMSRESLLKEYKAVLFVPRKQFFGKIHQQMIVSALLYVLLSVFLFSLYRILFVQTLVKIHVSITPDLLMVNDADYSTLLSPVELQILNYFCIQPSMRIRCSEIQRTIGGGPLPECSGCGKSNTKASNCPVYKRTYNQILRIKKILETLNIGSIESAKNKQDILDNGWHLILYKKVILHRGSSYYHRVNK